MKCFEEQQQLAIRMIAVIWKTAHVLGDEELYNDVRNTMGNVVVADDLEELEEAMKDIMDLRGKVYSSAHETLWYMEHNWKMRERD